MGPGRHGGWGLIEVAGNRLAEVGSHFVKGLAFGEATAQGRDLGPAATLLGFVDQDLNLHGLLLVGG
jgi:hypothetical protein